MSHAELSLVIHEEANKHHGRIPSISMSPVVGSGTAAEVAKAEVAPY
jgi:hypothetical protein